MDKNSTIIRIITDKLDEANIKYLVRDDDFANITGHKIIDLIALVFAKWDCSVARLDIYDDSVILHSNNGQKTVYQVGSPLFKMDDFINEVRHQILQLASYYSSHAGHIEQKMRLDSIYEEFTSRVHWDWDQV